ncbi:MAG: MBL fold metallo-hydrolase [Mariprofundaceae bacterium]
MKVKFWGVRGSIPVPGPSTARYGGNTTCIEVRTDGGALIILDAGTGIFQLANSLLAKMPIQANIFITHTHWDHIQGLPFFIPIFVPGNEVRIHGGCDPVTQTNIDQVMKVQMQFSYFPIRESELNANMDYITMQEGSPVEIEDAVVTPIMMNHPVPNFGYRIDCNGKSVFFTGDHEPRYNIYAPEDDGHQGYQHLIDGMHQQYIDFIKGVDILINDSSYTPEEYEAKQGWGHSTYDKCIDIAREAKVKRLVFTHHEPTRHDDSLEAVFAEVMARNPAEDEDPEFLLAREGLELEI